MYNAIVAASQRGVRIRVVQATPNNEYPDIDSATLAEMKAIELRNLSMVDLVGGGILHTKLWVVDSQHFYVGSANMDWRSLTQVRQREGLLSILLFYLVHTWNSSTVPF